MPEYLRVRRSGRITIPAATRRIGNLQEGDVLEAIVEEDGSIRLVSQTPVSGKLAKQFQLRDIDWALSQKKTTRK